ncbi:MAG: CtkA family protein [Tindallia sp. MSAO_Bac2]|nr:MAG: CtkA family protein [Tindallia sp. MSAO_Bac2]
MDYSHFNKNNKLYSGAERKIGITIDHEDFIIKFRKKTPFGIRNNHLSEYLGSKIFAQLGIDVQEAYLGTYDGQDVVAIKDFVTGNQQFVAFNDIGESSIDEDRENFTYSYEDITDILRANNKLKDVNETIGMFWKLYVVDALLGNFDRHGGNWGFIKENNEYRLAPVFDNGSCLFPNLTDETEMEAIINSEVETNRRIYTFPTSQILLNGKKSSYYEVISSLQYPECNEALVYIYQRFDLSGIFNIINEAPLINETQKRFYQHIIQHRYDRIIRDSWERMVTK